MSNTFDDVIRDVANETKRDQLARELAEQVEEMWIESDKADRGEPGVMIPLPSRTKARQLLNLYEEDSSPSTLPGG